MWSEGDKLGLKLRKVLESDRAHGVVGSEVMPTLPALIYQALLELVLRARRGEGRCWDPQIWASCCGQRLLQKKVPPMFPCPLLSSQLGQKHHLFSLAKLIVLQALASLGASLTGTFYSLSPWLPLSGSKSRFLFPFLGCAWQGLRLIPS